MYVDHVTMRVGDIERTRDFLLTVFHLEEGERPVAIRTPEGHRLK